MRTTIRLDEPLLLKTKQLAAQTNRTLTAVIEDSLREMFARREQSITSPTIRLITVQGQGIQPGIDLDHSAALLNFMDNFNSNLVDLRGYRETRENQRSERLQKFISLSN